MAKPQNDRIAALQGLRDLSKNPPRISKPRKVATPTLMAQGGAPLTDEMRGARRTISIHHKRPLVESITPRSAGRVLRSMPNSYVAMEAAFDRPAVQRRIWREQRVGGGAD